MKRSFLFTAAMVSAALCIAVTGCQPEEEFQPPVLNPVSADDIAVPGKGGPVSIAYTVDNPVEQGDIRAEKPSDADWISDFDYSTPNEIGFNVSENLTELSRETEITVIYEYPSGEPQSFVVKVIQSAAEEEEPEPPAEDPFNIEVYEIGSTSAKVKTTPADLEMTYTSQLMTRADFDYQLGDIENAEAWLRETFEYMAYTYGMSLNDFLRMFLITGVEDYPYTGLIPETEHIVFAVGLDYECNFTTEFFLGAEFATTEVVVTDLTFDMVLEPQARKAHVETTPSDMEAKYVVFSTLKSDCSGLSDEQIIDNIVAEYYMFIDAYVVTGFYERDFTELEPDTEYYGLAFGFEPSVMAYTSKLHKQEFRTLATADPSTVTFDISMDRVRAYFTDFTITPSDASVYYLCGTIDKATYDSYGGGTEALQRYSDEIIDEMYQEYVDWGYTWAEIVEQFYVVGETEYTAECLTPQTDYYVWAATCDEQGKFLSAPAIEPFTTTVHIPSEAYVPGVIDEYFDGFEIAEYNPLYGGYQGMVLVPVVYHPNDAAVDWCISVFMGDVVATEGEENVFMATLESAQWGQERVGIPTFALMYDTPYTVTTIAIDADGNYGEMYHEVYTMTRDGVAPAENVDYYFGQFMPDVMEVGKESPAIPSIVEKTVYKSDFTTDRSHGEVESATVTDTKARGKIISSGLF